MKFEHREPDDSVNVSPTNPLREALILVSGLRESLLKGGKRWTAKKEREYQELRCFIEALVLRYAQENQDLSVLFF